MLGLTLDFYEGNFDIVKILINIDGVYSFSIKKRS